MAILTPDQLPNTTTVADADVFIMQQNNVVGKVNFAVLREVLLAAAKHYIDLEVTFAHDEVATVLTSVNIQLSNKSPMVHTHAPSQVGLGNVANLAPADLPLSDALINALLGKADTIGGGVGTHLEVTGTPAW